MANSLVDHKHYDSHDLKNSFLKIEHLKITRSKSDGLRSYGHARRCSHRDPSAQIHDGLKIGEKPIIKKKKNQPLDLIIESNETSMFFINCRGYITKVKSCKAQQRILNKDVQSFPTAFISISTPEKGNVKNKNKK